MQDLQLRSTTNILKNLNEQINSEVLTHIFTPSASVPYYRDLGNDVVKADQKPLTVLKYFLYNTQIRDGIALYNSNLNSQFERRVVVTAENIEIEDKNRYYGETDIKIRYRRVQDFKEVSNG